MLRRLLKVGGYLLFLVLFLEVGLQGFYFLTAGSPLFARVGRPLFAPDEHAGYRVKSNLFLEHATNEFRTVVSTNSQGFRVADREEYAYEAEPGTYRILLMGPSFAFGWGVDYEDSFGTRLAALLEEGGFAGGRRVELINAGVPAQDPWLRMRWYEGEGRKYSPDLVIQLLYASMALPEPKPDRYHVTEDGYLVDRNLTAWRKLQLQVKKSALVFYGWTIFTRATSSSDAEEKTARKVAGAGRELEIVPDFDPRDPRVRTSLDYYESMAEAVARNGSRLLFVYTPLAYSVHRGDMARWRHLGVVDVDRQIEFDREFCGDLGGRGIDCLNITDDLIRHAHGEDARLYYWLDIHWTPRGNRVAAEAVADHLLRSEPAVDSGEQLPRSD